MLNLEKVQLLQVNFFWNGVWHVDDTTTLIVIQDGWERHLVAIQKVLLFLRVEVPGELFFVPHQGVGKLVQCLPVRLKRALL